MPKFDLIHPDTSFGYNPFEYVQDDKDVLKLITNLIQNTTPKGSQSNDPFWEKSETALLQSLMLYLLHEAPPEEQNFAMIMEILAYKQAAGETAKSILRLENEYEKAISALSEEQKDAVRHYCDSIFDSGAESECFFYWLGLKDGIRLWKFMKK